MKVCFVISSADRAVTAGVRIRYHRIRDALGDRRLEIRVSDVESVAKERSRPLSDIYVFSKVYSGFTSLLAERLHGAGKLVGVDVFDDHFTQTDDPRLQRYREWLRRSAPDLDFALCSTESLRRSLATLLPNAPCLVIPDTAVLPAAIPLAAHLDRKMENVLSSRALSILWFGIGSNPYFPVGLRDLAAFGQELSAFRRLRWSVDLKVLTDKNSMSADDLAGLARLPANVLITEWSAKQEALEIERNFLAFIPVNAQRFSTAKSLNRAISALAGGCQVLSNGFPLYDSLDRFIYSRVADVATDLATGRMRVNAGNVEDVLDTLASQGDPSTAKASLFDFLNTVSGGSHGPAASHPKAKPAPKTGGAKPARPPAAAKSGAKAAAAPKARAAVGKRSLFRAFLAKYRALARHSPSAAAKKKPAQPAKPRVTAADKSDMTVTAGLLHGSGADTRSHKVAPSIGALSIKTPFTTATLNFQMRFDWVQERDELEILIRQEDLGVIAPAFRQSFKEVRRIGVYDMVVLDAAVARRLVGREADAFLGRNTMIDHIVVYQVVMDAIIAACRQLMPQVRIHVSDTDNLRTLVQSGNRRVPGHTDVPAPAPTAETASGAAS